MTLKTLSERIDALETRLAFQDETIETLNQTITAQWQQIDALTRQIAALSERLQEAEARRRAPTNERAAALLRADKRTASAWEAVMIAWRWLAEDRHHLVPQRSFSRSPSGFDRAGCAALTGSDAGKRVHQTGFQFLVGLAVGLAAPQSGWRRACRAARD